MPICPHCVAQAVIAFFISIPMVAYGVRALRAKYKRCDKECGCDCHKKEKE